ncbi:acidobacterial duplicated orphan permease [uncultured Eubacterium sp.]|nr:acidobacterial duplicated orphan permease [uncultured Eubacterium sp.]
MLGNILKKDLKKRKGVNLILFLFITIATVFLASSVNNILVVAPAVDYYMDYANVPDVYFNIVGTEEEEQVDSWLQSGKGDLRKYGKSTMMTMGDKDVSCEIDGRRKSFRTGGSDIYLGSVTEKYCKVFDQDGNPLNLGKGEIAMTKAALDRNKLEIGDTLTLRAGTIEKNFVVKETIKDAAFGNDMVGMIRLVVNQKDLDELSGSNEAAAFIRYDVETDNAEEFVEQLNQLSFNTMTNAVTKDTYKMIYSFDMLMAALLILIGICLILIALLVLRFTLVFTMEEDYREIGIMKATGFRDFQIKKIYLAKYLTLVTSGSLIGLIISVPVSRTMIQSVSVNMIMEDSKANLWVNFICTALVIVLVMAFCYFCTKKLNKVSAITAIRGGQTGERYKRRAGLRLHSRGKIGVPVFLGMNDMVSHVRRYLVLMITFCISFILITIPLNTLNTMQSEEMALKFALNPEAAAYVRKIEAKGEERYEKEDDVQRGMARVEEELKEKGYDAQLSAVVFYFLKFGSQGKKADSNLMTLQIVGSENDFLTYDEGSAPKLSNEIAVSKKMSEKNGWNIGDTIETSLHDGKHSFIITGLYTDYMQVGESARMNPAFDLGKEMLADYWNIAVHAKTDLSQKELAAELKKDLPAYEWNSAQDVIDRNVGGIQKTLQSMKIPMTILLCAVIMLITLLMEKLFIVREKGEIAMLKSVGFSDRSIGFWQVVRMVSVAVCSMIAAVPLSLLSNQFVLKPIFAIMGAEVKIQVVPWQVYGVYPLVLLLGIIAATVIAARSVKRINIQELNNLE